jgi:hypothetical protein
VFTYWLWWNQASSPNRINVGAFLPALPHKGTGSQNSVWLHDLCHRVFEQHICYVVANTPVFCNAWQWQKHKHKHTHTPVCMQVTKTFLGDVSSVSPILINSMSTNYMHLSFMMLLQVATIKQYRLHSLTHHCLTYHCISPWWLQQWYYVHFTAATTKGW